MSAFRLIGHRGAAALYPENSLDGFVQAAERGVSWVEMDVRGSRDGIPVVVHDRSLWRTHGVSHRVGGTTAARLADKGVPRLEEVLDVLAARAVGVYVEVKDTASGLLDRILSDVRTTGARAILSSFHHDVVRAAREREPLLRTMALFRACPTDLVDRVRAAQADEAGVAWRSFTPSTAAAWRDAGVPVYAYTVNGAAEWARAKALGLSGVFTDDPFGGGTG